MPSCLPCPGPHPPCHTPHSDRCAQSTRPPAQRRRHGAVLQWFMHPASFGSHLASRCSVAAPSAVQQSASAAPGDALRLTAPRQRDRPQVGGAVLGRIPAVHVRAAAAGGAAMTALSQRLLLEWSNGWTPHLHRDWARPLPHLHRDWALRRWRRYSLRELARHITVPTLRLSQSGAALLQLNKMSAENLAMVFAPSFFGYMCRPAPSSCRSPPSPVPNRAAIRVGPV